MHDATGLHIYAGFIEPYLEVEVPRPDLSAPGAHWNPRATPQRTALDKGSRGIDDRTGQTLRELGFTAAAISPKGGIFRGRAAVVSLAHPSGDPSSVGPRVYRDAPYSAVSFETSFVEGITDPRTEPAPDDVRWSSYPNSQMGAIALIRQTLSDADWQGDFALKLWAAIGQLDETFRVPLVLFSVEGMSYDEIAEIESVPVGTVRSRISRARSALAEILANSAGSEIRPGTGTEASGTSSNPKGRPTR